MPPDGAAQSCDLLLKFVRSQASVKLEITSAFMCPPSRYLQLDIIGIEIDGFCLYVSVCLGENFRRTSPKALLPN